MKNKNYESTDNYINRELSWLEFNERVLEEAYDSSNPLFERLKFSSIVSSNLDEFFMVRVASLYDQVLADFNQPDIAGLTPKEQIEAISNRTHKMVKDQYSCYSKLKQSLKKEKIYFVKRKNLTKNQKEFIENYYNKNIYPVLTPMVVDRSRPFPLILNKSLNIALLLEDKENQEDPIFGTVQVPAVLNRIIEIPSNNDDEKCFIFLEQIIKMYMDTLFSGYNILTMCCYRITRNADQGLDEEGAEDLLEAIEQFLKQRKWGRVIRLEIEKNVDKKLLEFLNNELEVPDGGIYEVDGPIDLTFLMSFYSLDGYHNFKYEHYTPQLRPEFVGQEDIFEVIKEKDILMHHPFDSFGPVVELVKQAASDPSVLAIKQTLYRVSGNSPIIEALAHAAENGKQVTVLVELKARFDEQNNIIWARRLERAGCHVIYGLVGLKTHCKLLLIVRSEQDGIKRYVHMGTGNYNDVTAKFYTDIGLFTVNPYFGADSSAVFNMLSGYSRLTEMYKVDIAPFTIRSKFVKLIRQEAENAKNGKKARVVAKMNSLVDGGIIKELYKASNAGVDIDLIVRGICCLKPGVPGVSERINVRSIVGRFLEHSRIYCFHNDGDELLYLSSADWMTRNLDRRVELLFPVENEQIKSRVREVLNICLKDTIKSRTLQSDGGYTRIEKRGRENLNSQEYFYKEAIKEHNEATKEEHEEGFKPNTLY